MRWTRQRRPEVLWSRARAPASARSPARGARSGLRVRASLPVDDDAVRCGPGRRCALLASPLRAGPSRVVPMPVAGIKATHRRASPTGATTPALTDGDEQKRINRRRGEHEASRKNHRARNADDSGAFVVTTLVRFFTLRMRLRTLSERPAFRAPSVGEGGDDLRDWRARAIKNRADDACPENKRLKLAAQIVRSLSPQAGEVKSASNNERTTHGLHVPIPRPNLPRPRADKYADHPRRHS